MKPQENCESWLLGLSFVMLSAKVPQAASTSSDTTTSTTSLLLAWSMVAPLSSLSFIWIFGSPVRSTTLRLPKRASSSRRTLALTWLLLLQPLKSIIKSLDQSLKLLLKTLTTMTNCFLGNGVSHTKDWTWCVSAKKGMGTLVRVQVVIVLGVICFPKCVFW